MGQAPHTGDVFRGRTLKQRSTAGSQQPAAGCAVRPAPGSARRGAQQRGTPGRLRAPGALLKPQSPPLPPPPRRIPPGRGRGPPGDGRAPAPIPSAQHIATRRGLARHGRSPSAPSQSAEDGTPPPASPTSHPHPLPWPAWVRGGQRARDGSDPARLSPGAGLRRATGGRNREKGKGTGRVGSQRLEGDRLFGFGVCPQVKTGIPRACGREAREAFQSCYLAKIVTPFLHLSHP